MSMTGEIQYPMQTSNRADFHSHPAKKWWAPVWNGLVMDPGAKHYQRMRNAIWLFLYLLLNADRRSGFLVRKVKTICSDTGMKRNTVLKWLDILRKQGYIATQNTGRSLLVQVRKWKPLSGVQRKQHQKSTDRDFRCWKKVTPGRSWKPAIPVHFGAKQPDFGWPQREDNKYI